ncbi:hypothetical protein [Microbacterium kyungheense]|uniref:LysM domain-containing protein n=1 Tax=Microbacterium kyungheense TaxID=1263636 RepID=A0A543FLG6_9MICO|nr:hypothetical protein [Microbacterium kyungheense]TQM34710.1 hypothetical protein FB391_1000 [Microbacterium kyungheense]
MKPAAKITTGIAGVAVAGLVALAVPAFIAIGHTAGGVAQGLGNTMDTLEPSVEPTPEPTPEPTRQPTPHDAKQAAAWEIGCDDFVTVGDYVNGERPPRPDRGASEYASGTATYREDGSVATYTVAAGDSGMSIGERFCVDYITLYIFNRVPQGTLQPDMVLKINPEPPPRPQASED